MRAVVDEDDAFGIASPPGLNNAPRLNKTDLGERSLRSMGTRFALEAPPLWMRRLTAH